MKTILRNSLAVVAGVFIGSFVNMCIINVSGYIIPPPNGINVTTMEGLIAAMHLFEPKHFLMPFLAHALGTFVGAIIVSLIAVSYKLQLAIGIGILFLIGGIIMVVQLPSPLWFNLVDLGIAYIPMAYFGAKLFTKKKSPK